VKDEVEEQLFSAVYIGRVRHRRLAIAEHHFSYPLYMLGLDLDEIERIDERFRPFSSESFNLLSFRRSDYLGNRHIPLKQAVLEKVSQLGGEIHNIDRVLMLGQVRCLGFYFSPVNFFFCFAGEQPVNVLAEVRNTPWNERHCYLVTPGQAASCKKEFHVSPFMGLDMHYHWKIDYREKRILIHIENWKDEKLFDATLALKKNCFNQQSLELILKQWPIMSLSILRGIYWQAIRLFQKRVPFYSHP
jgi:DUF1365 family protein